MLLERQPGRKAHPDEKGAIPFLRWFSTVPANFVLRGDSSGRPRRSSDGRCCSISPGPRRICSLHHEYQQGTVQTISAGQLMVLEVLHLPFMLLAALVLNVPRFRRLPVLGSFLRE